MGTGEGSRCKKGALFHRAPTYIRHFMLLPFTELLVTWTLTISTQKHVYCVDWNWNDILTKWCSPKKFKFYPDWTLKLRKNTNGTLFQPGWPSRRWSVRPGNYKVSQIRSLVNSNEHFSINHRLWFFIRKSILHFIVSGGIKQIKYGFNYFQV